MATEPTVQKRGPMEQWAIEHGVAVELPQHPRRPDGAQRMFDVVSLYELVEYARQQDALVAQLVEALDGARHVGSVLRQLAQDTGTRLMEQDAQRIDAINAALAAAEEAAR